jgi:hypothetical protein
MKTDSEACHYRVLNIDITKPDKVQAGYNDSVYTLEYQYIRGVVSRTRCYISAERTVSSRKVTAVGTSLVAFAAPVRAARMVFCG